MSAGEFFDLVRPAFLVISALLSTWVLVNAQRHGFPVRYSVLWALFTFMLPLVTIPLYLLIQFGRVSPSHTDATVDSVSARDGVRRGFLLPLVYVSAILTLIAFFEYREFNSIDAHLARAAQTKVIGNRERTIREYRAAITLENNAHTHKLLGVELGDAGDWTGALSEFRLAEAGGEPDPSLPFRIAVLLDLLNQPNQALVEYKRFLLSEACLQSVPDFRCEAARRRVKQVDPT